MDHRILIIDHDTNLTEPITVAFARQGWSVSWRTRGEDGLAVLRDSPIFSAVAVGAELPDTRGLDLCRAIAREAPDTPVIFLAGDGGAGLQTAVEAMRAGAVDFIAKPFAPEEMIAALGRLMQRRESTARGLESSRIVPIDELERRYIHLVMEAVDGNKTQAARLLGLDRTTLYRKLGRYQELDKNGLVESERELPSKLL